MYTIIDESLAQARPPAGVPCYKLDIYAGHAGLDTCSKLVLRSSPASSMGTGDHGLFVSPTHAASISSLCTLNH